MNFYGKTWANTRDQSRLFSTFCIPNEQSELIWYSFIISLPENITMVSRSIQIEEDESSENTGSCSYRKQQND